MTFCSSSEENCRSYSRRTLLFNNQSISNSRRLGGAQPCLKALAIISQSQVRTRSRCLCPGSQNDSFFRSIVVSPIQSEASKSMTSSSAVKWNLACGSCQSYSWRDFVFNNQSIPNQVRTHALLWSTWHKVQVGVGTNFHFNESQSILMPSYSWRLCSMWRTHPSTNPDGREGLYHDKRYSPFYIIPHKYVDL